MVTNLRAIGVPNALSVILSLGFSFPFLQIFFRGLPLKLLESRPSVLEDLCGNIQPVDLCRTDISGIVGRGRNGVRGGETDFLPYG